MGTSAFRSSHAFAGSVADQRVGPPDFRAPVDDNEFDLRSVLGLLRRRAGTILSALILAICVASAALFLLPQVYSASALVLFDPSRKNLLEPSAATMATSADSARVDSEVEIIRSDEILLRVVRGENLAGDDEFGGKQSLLDQARQWLRLSEPSVLSAEDEEGAALDQLRKSVSIQRRGMTYVIAITVRSHDPARAAQLADVMAEAYISSQLQRKVQSVLSGRDTIDKQLIEARASVVRAETSFRNYLLDNLDAIVTATGNTELIYGRAGLKLLVSAQEDARERLSRLTSQLARSDWDGLAQALRTEEAAALGRQRVEIMRSLGQTDLGRPAGSGLHDELATINASLANQTRATMSDLQRSVTESGTAISTARQKLVSDILASNLPPDILTQFYGLQQASQLATSTYQALLGRLQTLDTEASVQIADSRLVSGPVVPTRADFPNPQLFLALALFVGLGTGVGIAFLRESYVGGFVSARQVEAGLQTRIGTIVPKVAAASGSPSLADLVADEPLSRFSEAIRRLRMTLDSAFGGTHLPGVSRLDMGVTILVCSALPGEGKTTTALALARTYALSGQRVLIIDCDMRQPNVHQHLNMDVTTGLIDILTPGIAHRDLSGVIVHDPASPAKAIVGSRDAHVPTDQLIVSKAFTHVITSARHSFDYIILDAPPIEPVVDTLYLAQHADAVVYVTRWSTTPQRIAFSALERLSTILRPTVPVMVALNGEPGPRHRKEMGRGRAYAGA